MAQKSRDRLKDGARRYSEGLGLRELPGLWRRDWSRAYAILTREHAEDEKPKSRIRRFLTGSKNLFFGLSYKLSPSRRLLFVICLVLAFFGVDTDRVEFEAGETIEIWTSPGLLVLALAGFAFLLVLELADRVLVRDELEVARQLQRDLLPRQAPALEGYEFTFSYRSANTVGGDYYDFVTLPDGKVALVSADASGHGIASALLMAISNSTLKLAVGIDPSPIAVARMMNRALHDTGGPRSFLTLFYGLLEPDSGRLEYVCAGHPFPVLRRSDGSIERLGAGSFPLGLRPHVSLDEASTTVLPGSLLMLYTDGIPETLNESGDSFGFDRVEKAVSAGGTAQAVHDRLLADLTEFEGDEKLEDDRSLVVISRR